MAQTTNKLIYCKSPGMLMVFAKHSELHIKVRGLSAGAEGQALVFLGCQLAAGTVNVTSARIAYGGGDAVGA